MPDPRIQKRQLAVGHQQLSWLAPDIICAILDGTQPPQLTGRKLTRANAIPLDWPSQRVLFGFA